jgi:DNA uptake protein ComE-like DNA-binding protein
MSLLTWLVAAPGGSQEWPNGRQSAPQKKRRKAPPSRRPRTPRSKAVKKAAAPDAIDLNAAPPEQLAKLGLDEATTKKIVDGRPFSSMDDPKIKEAVPADVLAKLEGKVTVKPPAKTEGAPAAASPPQ